MFRAHIKPAATDQRVPSQQGDIQEQLNRSLRELVVSDHPAEFDPPLSTKDALQCGLRFSRVDRVCKTATRTECKTKELELVRRRPSAVGEQFEAFLAHVGISLIRKQFDAIVESSN